MRTPGSAFRGPRTRAAAPEARRAGPGGGVVSSDAMTLRTAPLLAVVALVAGCRTPEDPPRSDVSDTDEAAVEEPEEPAAPRAALARRPARELARGVRDLLGVDLDVTALPADPIRGAFDGDPAVLVADEGFLTEWRAALRDAVDAALAPEAAPHRVTIEAEDVADVGFTLEASTRESRTLLPWFTVDPLGFTVTAPEAGTYDVTLVLQAVATWGTFDPEVDHDLTLTFGGTERSLVLQDDGRLHHEAFSWTAEAGDEATLTLVFLDGLPAGTTDPVGGLMLGVDRLMLEGPDEARAPSVLAGRAPCAVDPEADRAACAETWLRPRVRRAWRGPIEASTWDALVGLLVAPEDPEDGVALALEGVFLHPRFLHLAGVPDGDGRLDDHALAGRLASLVWGSVPDEALLACADAGQLTTAAPGAPCSAEAEAARLLDHADADWLYEGFVAQWLGVRGAEQRHAGTASEAVLADLAQEAREVLTADALRVGDLSRWLTGGETYLTTELAAHYGLPTPATDGAWASVPAPRGGLLGLGLVEAAMVPPGHPSVPARGAWVLARLACDPVDPPPNGVEGTATGDDLGDAEARANQPSCAVCHDRLDPVGLGLAGVDPLGRGDLSGAAALSETLDGPGFEACVAEHLARWTLGTDAVDAALVDRLVADGGADDGLPGLVVRLASALRADPALAPEAP